MQNLQSLLSLERKGGRRLASVDAISLCFIRDHVKIVNKDESVIQGLAKSCWNEKSELHVSCT